MDDELRFHYESLIREHIQAGVPPTEARRAARLAFGGIDQIKEDCRDTRWTRWLDELQQDLHYALRFLSKNSLFAIVTVVLIAATIGLVCAAYAVLDAVVLRTLPVPHPEELVVINLRAAIDSSIYDALERERQNISQIFGMKSLRLYGNAGNVTRSLLIYGIKGDYFGTVGAVPQRGRFLAAGDRGAVAIISDRLWRNGFGGDPDVLGRYMRLGLAQVTIVGVARPDFIAAEEPYSEWDAILPFETLLRALGTDRMSLQIVARLKAGTKAEKYEAQLNALWPALLQATVPPQTTFEQWRDRIGRRAQVESISHGINYVLATQPSIQVGIQMVFGLSILIFLSGCLALVLLVIARNIKNQQRTAVQMALGGGSFRVKRPFFLEILVLSALGCAIGLVIAWWWSGLGTSFLPDSQFINWRVRIDNHVIKLALWMTLSIVVILSSVTVLSGSGGWSSGKLSGREVSRPKVRLRIGLLALQLAMSVLLVHGALSFTATLSKLLRVPLGFDPEHLHIYSVRSKLPGRAIPDNYFRMLMTQIEQLPEVESAAITLSPSPVSFPLEFKQAVKTDDGREAQATIVSVSPGYLRALNLPLLSGRDFSWSDRNVAIVDEALLKKLYPDQDSPRGTILFGKSGTPLQIIGSAGKMAFFGPRFGNSTIAFVPCTALQDGGVTVMVRSKRKLEELRRDIQTLLDAPGFHSITDSVDQKTLLSSSLQQERMLATIAGAFGGLIVFLAGVELYAFCNYLLAMRTKELAIRASVGAARAQIAAALLTDIVKALGFGLSVGFLVALGGGRILSNLVKNINPPELGYLVLALVVVNIVTMSAVLLPTLKALRINIARELRID
jgi:predicted permease